MTLIEIFETVTCCSPGLDNELLRISSAVNNLKQKGVEITRHNLSKDPQAFMDNKVINDYIADHGVEALPITIVNNEIAKLKSYPTNDDFSKWTGIEIGESPVKPGNTNCSCGCS